jgi:hypothetical protein
MILTIRHILAVAAEALKQGSWQRQRLVSKGEAEDA